jgi:hypothetical protein
VLTVTCPYCAQECSVEPEYIGLQVECPACNQIFELASPPTDSVKPPLTPTILNCSESNPAILIKAESNHQKYLKTRKQKRSFSNAGWIAALIVGTIGLTAVLIIALVFLAGRNSPTIWMTKDQFRGQFASIEGGFWTGGLVSKKEVLKRFGKPHRTSTIGIDSYWTWQCSDGRVQLRLSGYQYSYSETPKGEEAIVVVEINDY